MTRGHDYLLQKLPQWEVWRPEEGETMGDHSPVAAGGPDEAAEQWLEEYEREDGNPTAHAESSVVVHVARVDRPDTIHRYRVHAGITVTYWTEQLDEEVS